LSTAFEVQKIALNTYPLEAVAVGNLASIVNADFEIIIRESHQCKGRLIDSKIVVSLNATGTLTTFIYVADSTRDLGIVHIVDFIKEGIKDE